MSNIAMNVDRTKVLFELSLINTSEETIYDKITQFTGKVINAPISLVSLVAPDHQFFKSGFGLPEPVRSERRTPLSYSFCKHAIKENKPLVVPDTRINDTVKDVLAIKEFNIVGYLGIPLAIEGGKALGTLCVLEHEVRDWTDTEIGIMTELSEIIIKEFDTRAYVSRKRMTKAELVELQNRIISFIDSIDIAQNTDAILAEIKQKRIDFDLL
ncbi:MAG: hypothetical protein Phog2KO_12190 [Phototrophicaceae bacterium]